MIVEYHRPTKIEDALKLIARSDPKTVPIAGGSAIDRLSTDSLAVVDLQLLHLDGFRLQGQMCEVGAALTLQNLLVKLAGEANPNLECLQQAIFLETAYNLRQVGSVAGTLVAADGRSPFTTVMLALDAIVTLEPGSEQVNLGDLLPLRSEKLRGRLITELLFPGNVRLGYEYVARTPADRPIVCVGAAIWPSGRTRISLGGFGSTPTLAFDGADSDGVATAASSAYSQAGDQWASAEYRSEIAGILADRAVAKFRI